MKKKSAAELRADQVVAENRARHKFRLSATALADLPSRQRFRREIMDLAKAGLPTAVQSAYFNMTGDYPTHPRKTFTRAV